LGNGSCCVYELDAATREFNPSGCIDLLNNTDCAAQSDGVTFFTQYEPGRECGVDDRCNGPTFLIGACCLAGGQCLNLFEADCAAFGRFDGGAGYPTLACGNGALPACNLTTGACCLAGFTCLDLTPAQCLTAPGDYQGDGTTCASGICSAPPAQFGACCFNDDTGLTVLSNVLLSNGGTFGVFSDDSVAGAGDGQTPYPVGPDNPLVVRNCAIVQSTGDPSDEDFESAEEACSAQGGQYIGDATDCSFCPRYGACCQEDECENIDLSTCIDSDLDVQLATDPTQGFGSNYWPTGANVIGASWYPEDPALNPTGRLFAPWYTDGSPFSAQDAILLNVGLMPDPTNSGGPGCPPTTGQSFIDIGTNNWNAALANWTGFLGFQNLNAVVGQEIPQGGTPEMTAGSSIPQVATNPGESTWNLACNPIAPLCDISYCSFWCAGPFSDSQGNFYNACTEVENPFAPVGCQNFVPRSRCGSGIPPLSPFFCGESGNTGVPTVLESDSGCTQWWNDPEEAGQRCFPDAVDNPLTLGDCGTEETLVENQLHGNCFWNRDGTRGFPTYCDTYTQNGPITPWGATYACYDGPYCDQYQCCEDVCAVNPLCCEWTDFPGAPNWNENCAAIATAMAAGASEYDLGARCLWDDWFPTLDGLTTPYPPACGITTGAINNQCMSPATDLSGQIDGIGENGGQVILGGCADLECCARVCASTEGIALGCDALWSEGCVVLAQQLCYSTVPVNVGTPNFTPLQFHLRGSDVTNGNAQKYVPVEYQPLISAPFYVHDSAFSHTWQSIDNVGAACLDPTTALQVSPPTRWSGPGLQLEQSDPFAASTGLRSWGEFMAQISRGNHPAGPNVNGTKGLGVKIAVLDMSAWIQEYLNDQGAIQGAIHEDLRNIKLEGRDTNHPPVRMIFDSVTTRPQRGTGVLGLIGATENDFGVTGLAPQAETFFFPVVDADLGFRESSAWLNAIDAMSSGDIITATYEANYFGQGDECSSLATDPVTVTYIGLALDAGVNVIVPAGDFGCNIGDQIATTTIEEIPNCIVVGGAMPNRFAQRWWTSNYTETTVDATGGNNSGTATAPDITCSSWGGPLVTTGGNGNLTRVAIQTTPDNAGGDPVGVVSLDQRRRSYTNDFGNNTNDGGSMAATAVVAGTLACTQGFSLQLFGVQMPPFKLVSLPFATGSPKERPIDFEVNSAWAEGPPYRLFDQAFEDGAPWSPGRSIRASEMGQAMVTDQNWGLDSSGFITDVKFVRGEKLSGAIASLREIDENYLSGTSEYQSYGWYNPSFYMPGRPYYGTVGQYVDVMIEYTVPASQPIGNQVDTDVVIAEPPLFCTVELFTWNWTLRKWSYGGLTTAVPGNGDIEYTYSSFSANFQDFVNSSGKMYQRVVTFSSGYDTSGGGAITTKPPGYLIRMDYIDLGFAPQSGGGGGSDG
jgi:hypothetical protein